MADETPEGTPLSSADVIQEALNAANKAKQRNAEARDEKLTEQRRQHEIDTAVGNMGKQWAEQVVDEAKLKVEMRKKQGGTPPEPFNPRKALERLKGNKGTPQAEPAKTG